MKRIFFVSTILAVCSALIGSTYAYYTVSSCAHNIITTGAVEIAVEEWHETDQGIVPYPKESIPVMPGRKISKIVTIRNLDESCYVRARIQATVVDADGNTSVLEPSERDALVQMNINTDFWKQKQGDENWWYYAYPIPESEVTEPLFEKVTFDGQGMGNTYQGCSIRIHVVAQAVQAENNAASAIEASGWPQV